MPKDLMQRSCALKEIDCNDPNNAVFELVTIFVCFLCQHIYSFFFPFVSRTSREGLRQAKDGTIIGMYKFLLVTNFGGH
jgi:hypothetical protein